MKEIEKMIERMDLDNAIDFVNEELSNSTIFETNKYYKLLFTRARIYMLKFTNTIPINNEFYLKAKNDLVQADNAYRVLNNKEHPKFKIAVSDAYKIYRELNNK